MIDRKYVRKRLIYIRNAEIEHIQSIQTLAHHYLLNADKNLEYRQIADTLMLIAQTLEIANDLITKVLDKI